MIAPQNYQKIKFECIYQFLDCEINRDIFIQKCDVNCPIIIIIMTKKNSVVGAYTSNFSTSSGGNKGVGDKNDFIF